jgi:hypothetical protein
MLLSADYIFSILMKLMGLGLGNMLNILSLTTFKICNAIARWDCFQKFEELGYPLIVTYLFGIMKMGKYLSC